MLRDARPRRPTFDALLGVYARSVTARLALDTPGAVEALVRNAARSTPRSPTRMLPPGA